MMMNEEMNANTTKDELKKELLDMENHRDSLEISLEEVRNMLEVIKHCQEDIEKAYMIISDRKGDILTHNIRTLETLINVTSDRVIKGLNESEQ